MRSLIIFPMALLALFLAGAVFAQPQFATAVGDTSNDYGYSVVQTSDGGFALAGYKYITNFGDYDFFLVKFSSAGTVEWSRAVGGTDDDYGYSVVQTSDGGFAVAGETGSFGAGEQDLFLVKFSSTGTVEWSRAVGGRSTDIGYSVVQTSDGGFVVAGKTENFGAGEQDLFLVKFSSTGSVEWSRAVGGTEWDIGYSVVQTSDGGFAAAGETGSFGAGLNDLFLVKFDSEGNSCIGEDVSPAVTSPSPSVASPSPSVATPSLTIIDTAWVSIIFVDPEVDTICTGFEITETITKPQVFAIDAFPNPFNSSVRISLGYGSESAKPLSASPPGAYRVEIFDINGRMVYAPSPSVTLPPGEGGSKSRMRAFIWTPDESLNSGIYLVRATAGENSVIKRIVYLR